jgi:hypothetical protein
MRKTSSLPNAAPDSPDYPFGRIVDGTSATQGTALLEATYSDFIQNLWHFVDAAGVTPTGQPDNKTAGYQLSIALQKVLDPIGNTKHWPVDNNFPPGYVLKDGRSLSKTAYPDLFALIGYKYGGSGDNFNIPNELGKFVLGSTSEHPVGQTGGEAEHAIQQSELPAVQIKTGVCDDNGEMFSRKTSNSVSVKSIQGENFRGSYESLSEPLGDGNSMPIMPPYLSQTPIFKIQYA